LPVFKKRGSYINYLLKIQLNDLDYIKNRVSYYNKIDEKYNYHSECSKISDIRISDYASVYFFDFIEFARFYSKIMRVSYLFGDVTEIPEHPSFVKTRPISFNNRNSIILKLNKIRHFTFVNDNISYENKKNLLIGRNVVHNKPRIDFFKKYFKHHLCDLGQINSGTSHDLWIKNKISINEHLKYKFILCIEGNDVASNLKWVMSSNSLAVCPKLNFESWFMEGKLISDFHYVLIKDDFSDLEEKLNYYMNNVSEALKIINNANIYIKQFQNKKRENLISLLVFEKYFHFSKQINSNFVSSFMNKD